MSPDEANIILHEIKRMARKSSQDILIHLRDDWFDWGIDTGTRCYLMCDANGRALFITSEYDHPGLGDHYPPIWSEDYKAVTDQSCPFLLEECDFEYCQNRLNEVAQNYADDRAEYESHLRNEYWPHELISMLFSAAYNGNPLSTKLLIGGGADVDLKHSSTNVSALVHARTKKVVNAEILELLEAASKADQARRQDKQCARHHLPPPAEWTIERRAEYLHRADRVVAGLRGANRALEDYDDQMMERARTKLDEAKTLSPVLKRGHIVT